MGVACAQCGGPNVPEAVKCEWCGNALPHLPPSVPLPPPPPVVVERVEIRYPRYSALGVIVAAVLIIVFIAVYVSLSSQSSTPPSGPSVHITGLNVKSPDNACGLNGDDAGTIQASELSGGFPTISWGLPGPGGSLPCTVSSVSTNTPGFSLIGSFPFNATSFPSVLIVSMITPSSFTGILNVTFT